MKGGVAKATGRRGEARPADIASAADKQRLQCLPKSVA
jgi:hypothetical protein